MFECGKYCEKHRYEVLRLQPGELLKYSLELLGTEAHESV